MSNFYNLFRKTASRIYKRKADDDGELSPLQQVCNKYSSSCFNLFQACIVGDVDAVRWYITVGLVDVNKVDKNGCTALFFAVQKNHVVLVKDLIKAGADVNMMASLEEGIKVTPVHIAAKYNRGECLKIILENGADANIGNSFGQTPLHAAARRKLNEIVKILIKNGKASVNSVDHDMVTALHLVATQGNDGERLAVAKTLLENGANPFCQDNEGSTVFHDAAENGVHDVLEMLCQYQGYDKSRYSSIADVLNKPRKDGKNCLHLAVMNDHEKVIKLCIDYKADVDKKTENGDAPLHIACAKGNHISGSILLENGANINITDKENYMTIHRAAARGNILGLSYLLKRGGNIDVYHHCGTALILASRNKQHQTVKFLLENGASPIIRDLMLDTCLHHAVKNGDAETVKIIMEKCGDVLLELKDKLENAPLHLAARTGNEEVLKILLSYKPDMRALDDRGKCPIHIAAENGMTECAKLLVQADEPCIIHVTDFMWRTPLHLACLGGTDLELVNFFLANGADPNARDDRRWTPLLYVASRGCPCCTKLLLEYGAKINEWDKNRMTALSLAATHNKARAVDSLLKHGADPTILNCDGLSCMDVALDNQFHDVSMVIAKSDKWKDALVSCMTMEKCLETSPEVAKVILDRCIEYSGREIDQDYKVTYNFELLDPHPDLNENYYGPLAMKIARRHELLCHPLTKKLLETNWKNGVRYIYYTQMFLLTSALIFLTIFLVYVKNIVSMCYVNLLEMALEEGHSDVQLHANSSFFGSEAEDACYAAVRGPHYDERRMFTFQIFFFVYFLCYLLKELNQLRLERWEYFLEITNYLDLSVSILFLMFVQIPNEKPIPYTRLRLGILGIFAYYFLMFLWTRGLTRFGVYIMMFLEVLATLLKVVSGFALLFICFSVTFYVTFATKTGNDFSTYDNALLKVMAMMMGELDYSGLREAANGLASDMQFIAIIVFILFCITMSLVVNNLLIGLAVGDIESVRQSAEIKLLSLQVNSIQETRAKMFSCRLRRRFYTKTLTEMPNKQDCNAELIQKKHILRNQLKNNKRKTQLVCA